jgi:ParB family chromosome partitioning protein
MTAKHGLGRGLQALIKDNLPAEELAKAGDQGVATVPLDKITKNSMQPRHSFAPEAMEDLVRSVKETGIVQPLLVRKKDDGYELIAGERRLRAAGEAGLTEVPVVVRDVTEQESLELALIENLQREDLNVVDEAVGYKMLAEKFGMTQERIAERVGKARASVANAMRLLELPDEVRDLLVEGKLSAGHAKVLLGLEIAEERLLLARQAVAEGTSVRALEKLVAKATRPARKPRAMRVDIPTSHVSHIVDSLRRKFGTSVKVTSCTTLANGKKAKGSIAIDYYSIEDLDRILEVLGIVEDETMP